MPVKPACKPFLTLLSPYVDGELAPKERVTLEQHLVGCTECTGRVADFRAESGLVRVGLEMLADEVDFRDFSAKVMGRITPEKPPLFERLKMSLSETFTYQRGPLVAGLAFAALVAVVIPFASSIQSSVSLSGSAPTAVNSVTTDEGAHVAPVVLKSGNDSIVWMVDHPDHAGVTSPAVNGGPDSGRPLTDANGKPLPESERPQGGDL